jgi:bacteriocin biosynthesis cyclodehydratase domain-containing protein
MGIRIDPTLEFIWRDPCTVQLGVDPPRAVVTVPTTAEERFLCALRRETGRDAMAGVARSVDCPPGVAARLLGDAAPALVDLGAEPAARVEVSGTGPLTRELDRMLTGDGVTVVRTSAPRGGPVPEPDPPPTLAVLVADHVTDPTVRAAWCRRSVPHLPVVVGDGRVRVGPFLVPGAGPCLQCVELERTDADPAWPAIAAQVWGRPAAPLTPYRAATVATTVTRLVLERLPLVAQYPDAQQLVIDRTDLSVTVRRVAPHPRCACRALPGTGSPPVPRPVWTPGRTTSSSGTDEHG